MQVEASTEIAARPNLVFKLLTDFGGAADRITSVTEAELLTRGAVDQGTRFRETRLQGDKEMTLEFEVTDWSPPEGFVVENRHAGTCWCTHYSVTPKGSRTLVHMNMEAKPLGFVGFLLQPLLWLNRSTMEQGLTAYLRDIERAAEAEAESVD